MFSSPVLQTVHLSTMFMLQSNSNISWQLLVPWGVPFDRFDTTTLESRKRYVHCLCASLPCLRSILSSDLFLESRYHFGLNSPASLIFLNVLPRRIRSKVFLLADITLLLKSDISYIYIIAIYILLWVFHAALVLCLSSTGLTGSSILIFLNLVQMLFC